MDDWPPLDSAAARIDEQDFIRRCAEDLRANEPPKRTPAPELVTRQELDARFEKIYGNILSVCEKFLARIEALEAKAQFLDEN